MLEISHSHEEGTLLAGTTRGDGSGEVVKACGWRWSRNLGCWYVQRSRDRDADMALIGRTVERLREAGVHVSLHGGCTQETPSLYSYRRDGLTGRHGGVVALLPETA